MADNINVSPSGSTPIATDDVSGSHYQRVKLTDGTADSTNVVQANADGRMATLSRPIVPKGLQALSVTGTSSTLTVPSGATYAIARCEGADIRFRDDGTAPTAATGFLVKDQEAVEIVSPSTFRAIRTAATSANLFILYYGTV